MNDFEKNKFMQQQQQSGQNEVVKHELSLIEMTHTIRNWWRQLLLKKKTIAIWSMVGGLLGIAYSFIADPSYTANTTFVLDNTKSAASSAASIAAKFGLGTGSNADGLFGDEDNIMTFIDSRTVVARTLLTAVTIDNKKTLLIDKYLQTYDYTDKWKSNKRLKKLSFKEYPQQNTLLADSIITAMHKIIIKKNLSVEKPDKEGNIISVTVTSNSEAFSKLFLDNLLHNMTEFYIETNTKRLSDNVKVLQRQVDSTKSLLDDAIYNAAINTDQVPNINPAFQRLKVPSQKKIVDVEMNKAILIELVKNLELAKVTLRKETPLIQVIDQPVLPLERKKTGKLKGLILGMMLTTLGAVAYYTLKSYLLQNQKS